MSDYIKLTLISGKKTLIAKAHIHEVAEINDAIKLDQGAMCFVTTPSGSTPVQEHIDVIEDMLKEEAHPNKKKDSPF